MTIKGSSDNFEDRTKLSSAHGSSWEHFPLKNIVRTSAVPMKSAARGGDLKCRSIIYNSIKPTVIVGSDLKSKKSETVKFAI